MRQIQASGSGGIATDSSGFCTVCQKLDMDNWEHPNPTRIAKFCADHTCPLCRFVQALAIFRRDFDPGSGVEFAFALGSVSLSQHFKVKTEDLKRNHAFSAWPVARTTAAMRETNPGRLNATVFCSTGVIRDMQGELDYGVVRQWLDFCSKHHSNLCLKAPRHALPGFRVINCKRRQIRLWSDISPSPYVTLSYVWGNRVLFSASS